MGVSLNEPDKFVKSETRKVIDISKDRVRKSVEVRGPIKGV